MDAIYKSYHFDKDDESKTKFVPTTEMLERQKCLLESIRYFKNVMCEHYEKFAEYEKTCRNEKQFLKDSSDLFDKFQTPACDQPEFHDCAHEICASLSTLTSKMKERYSEASTKRNFHWEQYCCLRDMCKHVQEIHSNMICQLCYQCEVQVALGCGHLMCKTCASRVSLCPSCRTVITQCITLYL
eukprot:1883571-Pleurochrysis_carterae.AAC.1